MTRVVTFYSYKGGVGRTMALVNTAHVLARDGWRVLMVDFDLEAPGMTYFFADQIRKTGALIENDALDLLLHAKTTLANNKEHSDDLVDAVPSSLAAYVVSLPLQSNWRESGPGAIPYRNGRLDLLPAKIDDIDQSVPPNTDRDYLRRMDLLDLPSIFSVQGPGHRFGAHLRKYFQNARFDTAGDPMFTLRDRVSASYDVVLLDSRTGLNEIAGLCIGPVSDALVVCAGLNAQNLAGTEYFMFKAGLLDKEKAKPYVVAAGPVPVWHTKESEKQISDLSRRLSVTANSIVEIPYHPTASISETVFIFSEPKDPISKAYERLAPLMVKATAADEAPEPLTRIVSAALRDDHGQLRDAAADIVGLRLARFRLPDQDLDWLRPYADRFPTGFAITRIPKRRRPMAPGTAAELALAAAVAAYVQQNETPFVRARELASLIADEESRLDFVLRLTYFQLRVLKTTPTDGRTLQVVLATSGLLESKKKPGGRVQPLLALDAVITALEWYRVGDRSLELPERSRLTRQLTPLLEYFLAFELFSRHRYLGDVGIEKRERAWVPNYAELVDLVTRGSLVTADVERLKDLLELMPEVSPGQHQKFDDNFRFGNSRETLLPLGLPVGVNILAALAVARGAAAAEPIVAWIRSLRASYGFGWRVLVNWSQLSPVLQSELLRDCLVEEAEEAEMMESRITSSMYPI